MQKTELTGQLKPFVPASSCDAGNQVDESPKVICHSPLASEWGFYGRQIPGFHTEGREGQFVIVYANEIVGYFPSWNEAYEFGRERYSEPFLVRQIVKKGLHMGVRPNGKPWIKFIR